MSTKVNVSPVTLFATPASMRDLEDWLVAARDPMVTTAAMMMYNLLVTSYELHEKTSEDA